MDVRETDARTEEGPGTSESKTRVIRGCLDHERHGSGPLTSPGVNNDALNGIGDAQDVDAENTSIPADVDFSDSVPNPYIDRSRRTAADRKDDKGSTDR